MSQAFFEREEETIMSKVIYNRTNWVNNDTAVNADHLNNIEQGIEDIVNYVNEIPVVKPGTGIAIADDGTISLDIEVADEEEF